MSLGLILIIILVIFLLGGFSGRFGGYGYGFPLRRRRVDDDALHDKGRSRHPGTYPDEMRLESICQLGGKRDSSTQSTIYAHMDHHRRVCHFP